MSTTEQNELKWRRRLRSRLSQDSDFVPPLQLKSIAKAHCQAIVAFKIFLLDFL